MYGARLAPIATTLLQPEECMSERNKTHNGRDLDGHFRVKREDVDELLETPGGADFVRDDVRLGGAVEDTGLDAGNRGHKIEQRIADNNEDVARMVGASPSHKASKRKTERSGKR
jgi:hypothetical protein